MEINNCTGWLLQCANIFQLQTVLRAADTEPTGKQTRLSFILIVVKIK